MQNSTAPSRLPVEPRLTYLLPGRTTAGGPMPRS